MAAIILFAVIFALTDAKLIVEPIPNNSPIIFTKLTNAYTSYESYSMIYHVDLKEYIQLQYTINKTINLASQTCAELPYTDMCSISITQLRTLFHQSMQDDHNMRIIRKKRGLCDWCGSLQSSLYGTIDHAMGEKIVNAINANGNETQILHDLMLNQTSLFGASLKSNQKSLSSIQKALNEITNDLNDTHQQIKAADNQIRNREKNQYTHSNNLNGIARTLPTLLSNQ